MIAAQFEAQDDKAAELAANISLLPKGDQAFAADLLACLKKKGTLSEKQWLWVRKLADAAELALVPDFTQDVAPPPAVGLEPLLALFDHASKYLKFPKITFQYGDDLLQLSLAGKGSSQPGSIGVTDGKGYHKSKWFGRITKDGLWDPSPKATEELADFLVLLAQDPKGTVSAHGHKSGHCSFCSLPLTDERSVVSGYGKVCAQRWGLPWGKKTQTPKPLTI